MHHFHEATRGCTPQEQSRTMEKNLSGPKSGAPHRREFQSDGAESSRIVALCTIYEQFILECHSQGALQEMSTEAQVTKNQTPGLVLQKTALKGILQAQLHCRM